MQEAHKRVAEATGGVWKDNWEIYERSSRSRGIEPFIWNADKYLAL
jgi:hypothetical protein